MIEAIYTEKLFSYGTLRYESVQQSIFGRKLKGMDDAITGFSLSMLEIKDKNVIETSGDVQHPILTFTGKELDQIPGVVFDISLEELKQADKYEVAEYKRINVRLKSGINAWVYVYSDQVGKSGN